MADLILPGDLAVWDPLGGTPEPVMTGHDGVCWHTMAGTFVGTDAYFHRDGWSGTESTVGVAGSGYAKQWVPWNRQADANLEGNARWLSIEFADGGETFPPLSTAGDESPPMTDAQLERGIRLCVYWCDVRTHARCPTTWRCHREGIPARFIASSCERGIGCHYHGIEGRGLVAGCPRWSASPGKICNRMVRFRQVRDIVVPEVARRLAPAVPPETGDDDSMFTYDYTKPDGLELLVLVAGGKQVRISGQILGVGLRAQATHIGEIGDDVAGRFAEAYGPVIS